LSCFIFCITTVELLEKFERSKQQFGSKDLKRIIEFSREFEQFVEGRAPFSSVSKLVKEYSASIGCIDDIKPSIGRIQVQRSAFLQLYEPVVSKIAEHLHLLLHHEALRGCSQVFLVGGFGESPILLDALAPIARAAGAEIFIPLKGSLSVMKGAVQFGLQPDFILERCARWTLGVGAGLPCRDGDPEELQYVSDDGLRRTSDRFSVFVTRGQLIPQSFTVSRTYSKSKKDQVELEFEVFSSASTDPQYVTDSGCKKLSSIRVFMPKQSSKSARVEFLFGPEMQVKVTECANPENVLTASIKFEQMPYRKKI
jgi:hypothetical protein